MAIRMKAAGNPQRFILFCVVLLLFGGCARRPDIGVTTLKPATVVELQGRLLDPKEKADLDLFRLRGPFAVTVRKDLDVRMTATERIAGDLYLSAPAGIAPLVVLLHGHGNSKDDHAYQALHLASWGIHALTLQLPNEGPWIGNGNVLGRVVTFIRRRPEAIDSRIDPDRIVLAGHSFGGSSVAIALAEGAPAVGGILLDPAGVGKALVEYLTKIRKPVLVIGSDDRLSATRDRDYFYEYIRSGVAEVSIAGAQHEDAQFPIEPATQEAGTTAYTGDEMQITFVSALTAAAFSLGFSGNLDYAWASFGDAIRNGKLFDALRK